MALSEQEEFELLSLERQRATSKPQPTQAPKKQPGMFEDLKRSLLGSGVTAAHGLLTGGPLGAAGAITSKSVGELNKFVEETGYKAGGAVTDIASKQGLSPEVAAGAGYATNVGVQALPVVGGAVAGQLAEYPRKLGRWFMKSAIKPPIGMRRSGEAGEAIETMLQKGIAPTSSGLEAAKGAVDDLEIAIQTKLENSEGMASKAKVGEAIKSAFDSVKHNLSRVQNEKDIDEALATFFKHPEIKRYREQFPVAVANRMKQAFTKELGDKAYQPGYIPSAFDKGQKSLAAGLREEVLRAEPAVKANLEEQSKMLQVVDLLKQRVGAAENQNIYGLGGAMSPSITRLMIYWADRYPWFKGWLARALYTGAYPMTAGAGAVAGVIAGEEIAESAEKRTK